MVKLRVDCNKLWMIKGEKRIQLESATVYKKPNGYEIIAFVFQKVNGKRKRATIKQKTFDGVPNVIFKEIPVSYTEEFLKKAYSSGSKESPTAMNWYINYYECKE